MANYTIPENPQYTAEIRKLENTDPANAETILNPLVETLIGNTHAVKLEADKKRLWAWQKPNVYRSRHWYI